MHAEARYDSDGESCDDGGLLLVQRVGKEVVLEVHEEGLFDVSVEGEFNEDCQSSCLAHFNECLGMPTRGFEPKILSLCKRMKESKERDIVGSTCARGRAVLSKFERELKQLDCFVKFIEK